MNNELLIRATECRNKIERLGMIIDKCSRAIEEVGHGADVIIEGRYRKIILSDCELDDGQEKLMQDMLVAILKNRIDDAGAELEMLLPKEEVINE